MDIYYETIGMGIFLATLTETIIVAPFHFI